jgi:nucleotide-binding universal stress UspA family protein
MTSTNGESENRRPVTGAVTGAVVCATDFSPAAEQAARIASSLARALGAPLELVHVVQLPSPTPPEEVADIPRYMVEVAGRALDRRIVALRAQGLQVDGRIEQGKVDNVLADVVMQSKPALLVLGSHGRHGLGRFLGSVAERMVQRACCPVLLVPEKEVRMGSWHPGGRPLRITVGVDQSPAAAALTDVVAALARSTPCQLDLVHLFSPARARSQLGVGGGTEDVAPDPWLSLVLERELKPLVAPLIEVAARDSGLRFSPFLGHASEPLVEEARASGADLLALGNNSRRGRSRLMATLRRTDLPVLCVPPASEVEVAPRLDLPPIRTVLVTTDFSPRANAAIPHAYRLAGDGGAVIICHVADPGSSALDASVRGDLEEMLKCLAPQDAAVLGIATHTFVHEGKDTAEAIVQVQRRLGADLVVMSSHGRTGLARALLGSVAESVVRRATVPVVVVPLADRGRL